MKLKFNTSRELKILLGVGLLALGIYLWLNFLSQNNASLLPSFLGGNSSSSASQIITSPRTSSPRVVPNSTTTGSSELVVAPLTNNSQAVAAVSPNLNNAVATTAREIIIVDLPFLITEAPVEEILTGAVSEENAIQNRALRATVNPFSPILIEVDKDKKNVTASTPVQTVSGQSRPTNSTPIVGNRAGSNNANGNAFTPPAKLIESAPLRTVTPAPALANNLPRTLATGTLNVTPGILRNQNVVPPLASEVAAAEKAAAIRLAEQEAAQAEADALFAEAEADRKAAEAEAAQTRANAIAKTEAEAAQAEADRKAAEAQASVEAAAAANAAKLEASKKLEEARLAAIEANNPSLRMPKNNTSNLSIAGSVALAPSSGTLPNILSTGRDAQNIPITVAEQSTNPITNEPIVTVVDNSQNAEGANGTDSQNALTPPIIEDGPIEVGGSDLSRYLRDNNYQYTGSVRGVVSVGMFRTSVQAITITLGQTIPKTDIVLTDLQNNQAEFTQGQDKVILNLDLRR